MNLELSDFWTRFRNGIEVAVASADSEKLLGVRDGFHRYFHDGLERPVPVSVKSEPDEEDATYIPLSDEETLQRARDRALELHARVSSDYSFSVCSETGLHTVEVEGQPLYFVRSWTVVCGPGGEGLGGSGSLQLPRALINGLDEDQIPFSVPGTRRRGGMTSSITGGLETRRNAVAVSTLHAVASLLFGILESRPVRDSRAPGGWRLGS